MSLLDAVLAAGSIPLDSAPREEKKAYSERLSRHLAVEVAQALRAKGFRTLSLCPVARAKRNFRVDWDPRR